MLQAERLLQGRTALVTGAGQNIGKAIALALAGAGANVVVNGRQNRDSLESVVKQAEALGVDALAVLTDVSDPNAVAQMVEHAALHFGSVDISVSNVGVRPHQPFLEITPEDWNSVLATNLSPAFYLARAALPHMVRGGWGRIIHISGRDGFFPKANRAHNVTCKAGLHALAKAIALEFGQHGVTANTVAPGPINTERDLANYPDFDEMTREWRKTIPLGRLGTVEEVADACLFLSASAGFTSGQLLHVNGGESMF